MLAYFDKMKEKPNLTMKEIESSDMLNRIERHQYYLPFPNRFQNFVESQHVQVMVFCIWPVPTIPPTIEQSKLNVKDTS